MDETPNRSTRVWTFEHTLTPDDHGRFVELRFEMPPDTETIGVSCTVQGQERAGTLVDLGLRDPARVRGWSGGARDEFVVGHEQATPGYLPGALAPGEWAVLLASNRIPETGCTANVTVTCTPEGPHWLKGDLHVHSTHSDGDYALHEVITLATAAGLDFVALTDHNTISQNVAMLREAPIVQIPGMELTTYRGHATLLGVVDPLEDFRVSTMDQLRSRVSEARRRGAHMVLAHPYESTCSSCAWQWDWDIAYDWIEVWNGPWRPDNQRTLDWWQAQLVSGRRLVAVAGSDTHRPHPYIKHGWPTTWVYSRACTVAGILTAIGRGHVSMSYAPDGPLIDVRCAEHLIGDEVPAQAPERDLRLRVIRLERGDTVRIISERGTEQELTIDAEQQTLEHAWPAGDRRFYRIEVWRHFPQVNQTLMAAMCNPIYTARYSGAA